MARSLPSRNINRLTTTQRLSEEYMKTYYCYWWLIVQARCRMMKVIKNVALSLVNKPISFIFHLSFPLFIHQIIMNSREKFEGSNLWRKVCKERKNEEYIHFSWLYMVKMPRLSWTRHQFFYLKVHINYMLYINFGWISENLFHA